MKEYRESADASARTPTWTPQCICGLSRLDRTVSHKDLGSDTEFKASDGWLYRFQKGHAISQVTIFGNQEAALVFHDELRTVPANGGYTEDQGYNVQRRNGLMDQCSAHPPAESLVSSDGKIRVMFLPKNTTSHIQTLAQGIIKCFKSNYR